MRGSSTDSSPRPRRAVTGLLVLLGTLSCGGPPYAIEETRLPLALGDGTVDLVRFDAEAEGRTFLNLHDDEQTSVEAALDLLAREGGTVFELQHGGERNLRFALAGAEYVFDPNRMFSDGGAMVSLAALGTSTPEAFAAVRAFADEVLEQWDLAGHGTVIALHNNAGESYRIDVYQPGGAHEADAAEVFVGSRQASSEFFFVTDPALFEGLRALDFNVVLQDNAGAPDDGSLSIHCARQGLPYANSEALQGHRPEQLEMLSGLQAVLEDLGR
ncbi:MAG: hypothetical protein P1V51_12440 [Deltaproteobacteria bacterium]|nr:hypothetical protein [Deltaproteobacteria bacterium]